MKQYPERAECDFWMMSRFPWEERRLPQKWSVEVEQKISEEIAALLQALPSQYRKDVWAKIRRILLIKW